MISKILLNTCTNNIFLFCSGSRKILVGVEKVEKVGFSDDIEIIDLDSSATSCERVERFPLSVAGAIGGLDFDENPMICGGIANETKIKYSADCHTFKNGSWTRTSPLSEPRFESHLSVGTVNLDVISTFILTFIKSCQVSLEPPTRSVLL